MDEVPPASGMAEGHGASPRNTPRWRARDATAIATARFAMLLTLVAPLHEARGAESVAVKRGGVYPLPSATAKSDRLSGAAPASSGDVTSAIPPFVPRPAPDLALASPTPALEAPGRAAPVPSNTASRPRAGPGQPVSRGSRAAAPMAVPSQPPPPATPPRVETVHGVLISSGGPGTRDARAKNAPSDAADSPAARRGDRETSKTRDATSGPPGRGPGMPAPSAAPRDSATSSDAAAHDAPAKPAREGRAAPSRPTPPPEDDGQPGEILWSVKTAALPGPASDAAASGGAIPGLPHASGSGGPIELAVPLRDGTFYLGDVSLRISPAGAAAVARERFVQLAVPLLRADAAERLNSLPAPDGYLPLGALKEAGLDTAFDSGKVEMRITPTLDQRATSRLSLKRQAGTAPSESLSRPAILAGFLNIRAGANYISEPFSEANGTASGRLAFDGALRWAGIVLETGASFDGKDGLTREDTRLVHDMPDAALRLTAGDIAPLVSGRQGAGELLGISIEKSHQKLQPGRDIRATGSRSFRLERPSSVEVLINGRSVQRLQLRPGDHDLDDLPLTNGANDISLVIEDDVGNRRSLDFTLFSARSLLAPGVSEWAVSAGIASRAAAGRGPDLANGFSTMEYDTAAPIVTGFHERGLTPGLTASMHLQAATDGVMGGAGARFQTGFGFWALDASASQSPLGPGMALGVGYDLANIVGGDGVSGNFRFAADYYTAAFAPIDGPAALNEIMAELSAVYSRNLPWDLSGSLSGSYAIGRDGHGDRYGVDLSLSRPIGAAAYAGLSIGYEDVADARERERPSRAPGVGFAAAVTLTYRLDDRSGVNAAHDLGDARSRLGYRHAEGSGVGSWSATVDVERKGAGAPGGADDYTVAGALGYTGNRAEVSVSQHAGLAGLDTERIEQRTGIAMGTAVAFADGRVAVGRPVGDGFAIVAPHDTLGDGSVQIGAASDLRAASGVFGPALIPDMSPYSAARLPYDVSGLPTGYDLGAGVFDVLPAYKSGYGLIVGSDYTVTAHGTLLNGDGEPVALLTGTAREEGQAEGPEVTVFTNRDGRFGAQGLRPGRWVLDMATEPPTRYVIAVPKDAVGLVKLDVLKPEGAR